jgi:hypothetical protein
MGVLSDENEQSLANMFLVPFEQRYQTFFVAKKYTGVRGSIL